MRRRIIITLMSALLVLAACAADVSAATMNVQYDDGSGTMFRALPVNYVQILNTGVPAAAIVSGSGYSKVEMRVGTRAVCPTIVWQGKLNYGGSASTSTSKATLKDNTLPTLTLKYPNCARLSDGTYADIIMEITPVVSVSKPYSSGSFTSSTNVYVPVLDSWSNALEFMCAPPRTSIAYGDSTSSSKLSGCNIGIRDRVTMKICSHTAGNTIGSAVSAPSMLLVFNDFDVPDWTTAWGNINTRYDGFFSEGVEMVSGFQNPVVLAPKISGDSIQNQSLVNAQTVNGNTKIKGYGEQYRKFSTALNRTADDKNTYYSGMAVGVDPAGCTFYWTGSRKKQKTDMMGTCLGGQPTVAVKSMRGNGGSLTGSGLNYWQNNTHLMNSSAAYYYAPAQGYFVKRLAVDGVNQAITEDQKFNGGAYTFTRLNKNPVPKRIIRNGNVLDASESSCYTIQAEFGHIPVYRDNKITDKKSIRTGSNEEITYVITSDEIYQDAIAGTHELKDDMADGLLKLVPNSLNVSCEYGSYTVNKADDTGIDITFRSNEAAGKLPRIAVTYKATVNWDRFNNSDKEDITNICSGNRTTVRVTNDLKITKRVAGSLRDMTKKFEITSEFTGLVPLAEYKVNPVSGGELAGVITGDKTSSGFRADDTGNAVLRFRLTGGQGAEIKDLPLGAKYKLTESSSDHIPAYKMTSDAAAPVFVQNEDSRNVSWSEIATSEETIDKDDGIVTVAFINTRNRITLTGIVKHYDWIIAAALVAAAALTAVILRRRKGDA